MKIDEGRTGEPDAVGERDAFVERFAAAWRAGSEGLRGLEDLVHPDVVLTQPMMPPARGLEGFRAFFESTFAAVPDLRGEVLAWGPTDDGVLIDLLLRGTVGGRPVELITCDRVVLRDGLMAERHARMDPLPLVRAVLRSPGTAMRLLRRPAGEPGDPARGGSAAGPAGLATLAAGRLLLGVLGRVSPRATARLLGAGYASSPELDYMTRIFGARAVALGTGYLLSRGDARRTWHRISLGVDISDTIAGIGHLRRGDVPRRVALALTALTGSYAAVGAAQLARDLAAGR